MRDTLAIGRPRPPAVLVLILATSVGACGSGVPPGLSTAGTSPVAAAPARAHRAVTSPLCRATRAVLRGRVRDRSISELSGLARSRRHPRTLFAVEDSGAAAALLAFRPGGAVLGHQRVVGASNGDWEDLAAGPGPDGRAALFVGDIGDNNQVRDDVQIYRIPEPAPTAAETEPAARLDLRYPDQAHDAEALLVDPLRRELVIVTKGFTGGRAYTTASGWLTGARVTLQRGPAIPLGPVTAGDVSADGRIVALRTYDTLAVWRRRAREPLTRTLARHPTCIAPVSLAAEGQGEALALDRHGRTAITAPEGPAPLLRRYG